jgi:long-chain acyl-CoA synthetase
MLHSILAEHRLRGVRLWQRTNLVPSETLVNGHEALAKSFSWGERNSRRIAFLLGNEPVFAVALLATLRRGDSAILLNPTIAAAEITDVLSRTTPRLIVTSAQHLSKLRQLDDVGRQVDEIHFDPFGDVLVFESTPKNEFLPVRDDEFVCQITSGVSGRAQIVSRTYANIDAELENFSGLAGVSAQDTVLCPVPLFHSYGLFVGLLPAFATGAACVLAPNLLPGDVLGLTRFHRPTILLGVPFLYELLLKSAAADDTSFGDYRYLFSAGAPLSEKLATHFLLRLRTTLNPLYGTTETGVIAVALEQRPYLPGFVGSPLPGTSIRIFGEDKAEMPVGQSGEIGIISRATGRYEDQARGATGLDHDWFFPGDMGCLDGNRNLYVTGRKFSLINVASLKVDPIEVENALLSSGLAMDCAVVGVTRPDYGEFIRAYVVTKFGVSVSELRAACREKLAPFKVPREFVLVDDLPRSATGKVLRKYLTDTSDFPGYNRPVQEPK